MPAVALLRVTGFVRIPETSLFLPPLQPGRVLGKFPEVIVVATAKAKTMVTYPGVL